MIQDPDSNKSSTSVSRQARDWVVRLASGEMSPKESDRFQSWLNRHPDHRAAFEREQQFWQQLDPLKAAFVSPPLPQENCTNAGGAPRFRGRRATGWGLGFAAAACLMIVALGGDLKLIFLADHRTAVGEQARVPLPDGSSVLLNTDSAITVRYAAGERHIQLLRGEALFEVKSNPEQPFRVAAGGRVTQAVGTAFIVSGYSDRITVTVTSGTVAVGLPEILPVSGNAPPHAGAVEVHQGEQVTYPREQTPGSVRKVDLKQVAAWSEGKIIFEGLPFPKALEALDRYHPGRILFLGDAEKARQVSGIFKVGQIDQALDALAATQNLSVTRMSDYLVLVH